MFREKKYEEGIKYLKESLETEERTTEALYLLGVSCLWLGQYANAIKVTVKMKFPLIICRNLKLFWRFSHHVTKMFTFFSQLLTKNQMIFLLLSKPSQKQL